MKITCCWKLCIWTKSPHLQWQRVGNLPSIWQPWITTFYSQSSLTKKIQSNITIQLYISIKLGAKTVPPFVTWEIKPVPELNSSHHCARNREHYSLSYNETLLALLPCYPGGETRKGRKVLQESLCHNTKAQKSRLHALYFHLQLSRCERAQTQLDKTMIRSTAGKGPALLWKWLKDHDLSRGPFQLTDPQVHGSEREQHKEKSRPLLMNYYWGQVKGRKCSEFGVAGRHTSAADISDKHGGQKEKKERTPTPNAQSTNIESFKGKLMLKWLSVQRFHVVVILGIS